MSPGPGPPILIPACSNNSRTKVSAAAMRPSPTNGAREQALRSVGAPVLGHRRRELGDRLSHLGGRPRVAPGHGHIVESEGATRAFLHPRGVGSLRLGLD